MTQLRKHSKLILSCILLCLLYFVMEASYFLPPSMSDTRWYSTAWWLVCFSLGIPSLFLAPVIAFFQGVWSARNTHLRTASFLLRLLAIVSGCALNLVLTSIRGWYVDIYGWFSDTYILASLPPLSFLVGGILIRGGKALRAWIRTRTRQWPCTPNAHTPQRHHPRAYQGIVDPLCRPDFQLHHRRAHHKMLVRLPSWQLRPCSTPSEHCMPNLTLPSIPITKLTLPAPQPVISTMLPSASRTQLSVVAVSGDVWSTEPFISIRDELRRQFVDALARTDVERDMGVATRTAVHRTGDGIVVHDLKARGTR